MQAKKKPLEIKSADDLGIGASALEQPRLIWESSAIQVRLLKES